MVGACPAQEPVVKVPLDELYVALQSVVAAAGGAWLEGLKLLGVYPKPKAHAAGMPFATSSQPKPSAVPVPVQFEPQETSFWPVVLTHLPLLHWLSAVQ
jgi:hypothetical protein